MAMEMNDEIIFKMIECANEIYSVGEIPTAIILLREADRLCDQYKIDMPPEGINLNIELDERCGTAVL